jgi:hypothetical protein
MTKEMSSIKRTMPISGSLTPMWDKIKRPKNIRVADDSIMLPLIAFCLK